MSCSSPRSDFHEADPPIKDSKVDNLLTVSPFTSVAPELGNGRTPEQGSRATGEQHSLVSLAVQDGRPPLKAGPTPLPPTLGYGVRWCRVQILAGQFRGDALDSWAKVGDRHFSELRLKRQVTRHWPTTSLMSWLHRNSSEQELFVSPSYRCRSPRS